MSPEPCNAKYYGIPCKKACCVDDPELIARLQARALMGLPLSPQPEVAPDTCNDTDGDGAGGQKVCVLQKGHRGFHSCKAGTAWLPIIWGEA